MGIKREAAFFKDNNENPKNSVVIYCVCVYSLKKKEVSFIFLRNQLIIMPLLI